jgi:hypothetical protein
MIQAFYQSKPIKDTPYRQLSLNYDEEGALHLGLFGGTKWGPKETETPPISDTNVADFDEGLVAYNKAFEELRDSGWKPYTPYDTWD